MAGRTEWHKKNTSLKGRKPHGILFGRMQWAMLLFCLMIAALLFERRNIVYTSSGLTLDVLEQSLFTAESPEKEAECLLIWDSSVPLSASARKQMSDVLSEMKVSFREQDMQENGRLSLSGYENVVIATDDYDVFGEQIFDIFDAVKNGTNLLTVCPPSSLTYYSLVMGWMGIREIGDEQYRVAGLRFASDFMLGGEGKDFEISDPYDSSSTVSLYEDCTIHLVSADDRELPIIWECSYGKGTVVVNNLNYFEKAYRGFYAASYSLLSDVCVYPVINASAFYLDDFPSPVPVGEGKYIEQDYHMDIGTFYTNVWWPDVKDLAEKYGVRYTGLVIENYSDENSAPLEGSSDIQRFRYFGNDLLDMGGEIGYHGYNHMPLVLDNFDYGDEFDTYKPWESPDDIRAAMAELDRFCRELYPDEAFQVYVPPSNILSKEGRQILAEDFLDVKAIASIYFTGEQEYEQEFEVAADGIVETPRVISGYVLDSYMQIAALSELNMHFVSSHFQHPDDTLDEDRGAALGWETMRNNLDHYMDWLYTSAPMIRNLTGTETAGAVQRYYYLDPQVERLEDEIRISLSNFQDEAWLFVRINEGSPAGVQGGELTELAGGLYLLRADAAEISIGLASGD